MCIADARSDATSRSICSEDCDLSTCIDELDSVERTEFKGKEDERYKMHDLRVSAEYWLQANVDSLSDSFGLAVSMTNDRVEIESHGNVYHHEISGSGPRVESEKRTFKVAHYDVSKL